MDMIGVMVDHLIVIVIVIAMAIGMIMTMIHMVTATRVVIPGNMLH